VALIGAGPASLAAAHELRRHGHRCTIYEKRSAIGGLNTTGVAPYKMKADRSVEEVDWVLGIGGIDVKTGVDHRRDVTFEQLEKDHDAVFIGASGSARTLARRPGAKLPGVVGAVDWIEQMKLGKVPTDGVKSCVVVGGGNTALDCVREALGLGIPQVTMVYRGVEEKMSGYAHEWKAAQTKGARVEWQALPVAYEGDGKVQRVRCQRLDTTRSPSPGPRSRSTPISCSWRSGNRSSARSSRAAGRHHHRRRSRRDGRARRTGRKGWYAGGDCRNGGKEVVNAAAEGKAAARAIHAFVTGASNA
jgi:dihydropyrimidine dehydrogenase (NAD+) subunit PreT